MENCIKCNETGKCYECIKQYQILNGQCFKTCEKGDNEKCLECDNTPLKITQNCSRCNKGYFLPEDSKDKTKCFPCELGCNNCTGKMNNSFCSLCEENFLLFNGKCNKKCLLGPEELCHTCDLEDKSQNCGSCNEGYYLPNNLSERRACHKCGKNMIQCHEDEDNNIVLVAKFLGKLIYVRFVILDIISLQILIKHIVCIVAVAVSYVMELQKIKNAMNVGVIINYMKGNALEIVILIIMEIPVLLVILNQERIIDA